MAQEALTWAFDERAHAGPEHLDPAYVAAYDTKSPMGWSDEIAALHELGIDGTSTVIDLGAGTGSFAEAVAPHVARVIGVDVSEAMVAAMRARGVEAVQAGFLAYEHDGPPVDAVHTRNALHHLPDFWKGIALDRVARLLAPGGAFILSDLVYSFDAREAADTIEPWLAAAPIEPARGWTAAQLAEHVREEHSTYTWLLEPMLDRAGFELRDRWTSESRVHASYTCIRR